MCCYSAIHSIVEVAAAIRRRTGSKKLAIRVKEDLLNIDTIHFVDLLYPEANEAANIASEIGVRGMDAIVIQTAKSYGSTLVTLDEEMADKAKTLVRKRDISELVD
ncbi:MAG: PIN domain-containing protein [Euryarchaeota archaeon]|nr:PIN domain-containing protein [Euryarchaeota archaeon]